MGRIPPLQPSLTDGVVTLRAWREFVAGAEKSREAGTSVGLAVVEAADEAALLSAWRLADVVMYSLLRGDLSSG